MGAVADALKNDLQSTRALVPSYPWISKAVPATPANVKAKDGKLSWTAEAPKAMVNDAVRFVVYRFDNGTKPDFENAAAIVTVTPEASFDITLPGDYYVTALNRVNTESKPSAKVTVKK